MRFISIPNTNRKGGLSLIELLTVLAILTILSSVVISGTTAARTKARATSALRQFKDVEKAIQSAYAGDVEYPTETELNSRFGTTLSNPTITNMVTQGAFFGYLESGDVPDSEMGTGVIQYDNDANTYADSCGSYDSFGVNLFITNAIATHPDIVDALDNQVDGGDGLTCGKIRRPSNGDNTLYYNISTQDIAFP